MLAVNEIPSQMQIPVEYDVYELKEDPRFLRLKIYVMHDGLNYNNSFFSLESMESAKESIKNIPILAFSKVDEDGNMDFGGHEMELVVTGDNEIKFRYLGRPIGVIPAENNNYQHIEQDGRNYVTVDGYVWKDYANEALDILEKDKKKHQSMEINVVDGEWNEEKNYYEIKEYTYAGITLLGDDVEPAMEGAKAEVYTIKDKVTYYNSLTELKTIFNYFASVSQKEQTDDEEQNDKNYHNEGGFEMTYEQLIDQLCIKLSEVKEEDEMGFEMSKYAYLDCDDSKVYVLDFSNFQIVSFEYNLDGDNVQIDWDSMQPMKVEYVPLEEGEEPVNYSHVVKTYTDYMTKIKESELEDKYSKQINHLETENSELNEIKGKYAEANEQLEAWQNAYNELAEEYNNLKEFKKQVIENQKEQLFKTFAEKLPEEDINKVKEKADELTCEEVESQLYIALGKRSAKFSKSKDNEFVSVPVQKDGKDKDQKLPYNGLLDELMDE